MLPRNYVRPLAARLRLEQLEDRTTPSVLDGVGVIGDSYTVERGGNNWTEQLAALRGFNFGPSVSVSGDGVTWLDYDYIQTGYPREMNNGVVSQAVSAMAGRVASGSVTLVYLDGIGNDFAAQYPAIYQGNLAGQDLTNFIAAEMSDLRAELDVLSAAGSAKFVLENVGDFGDVPAVVQNAGNFLGLQPGETPDPAKKQRFTDAIQTANAQINALADEWHVPVVDQFGWAKRVFDTTHPLSVGGLQMDVSPTFSAVTSVHVTDPLRLFIDSQHVGPVAQGLKANVVLDAIRQAYGADVAPLSDQEILTYAYGRAGQTPPTFGDTSYYDVSGLVHYHRATPVVTAVGGSFVYDGQPHPATGTVTGDNGENLGTPTFTYSYTDNAGNEVTSDAAPVQPGYYTVTASFAGNNSYEPATSAPAYITIAYEARTLTDLSNALHAGRAIPIKIELTDADGNNVSSPGTTLTALHLYQLNADGSRTELTIQDAGNANPDNLFRYDAALGGYIFNLSTKELTAGSYAFDWSADGDPTDHELNFQLV